MLPKSPPIAFDGVFDLTHIAPPDADYRGTRGYADLDRSQIVLRGASASADAQSPYRTLTGWRPVRIDESASFVDSGAL
jgi:hypothetical protein